jgi:4-aminobutyrate aminotransferase-like enzyme
MGPLSEFDLSSPEKAARVGNQLIDELEQMSECFPNAAKSRALGTQYGTLDTDAVG